MCSLSQALRARLHSDRIQKSRSLEWTIFTLLLREKLQCQVNKFYPLYFDENFELNLRINQSSSTINFNHELFKFSLDRHLSSFYPTINLINMFITSIFKPCLNIKNCLSTNWDLTVFHDFLKNRNGTKCRASFNIYQAFWLNLLLCYAFWRIGIIYCFTHIEKVLKYSIHYHTGSF